MPAPTPDIQAMLQGLAQGKSAFQGMMPSGTNAGGAPPASLDPAAPMLDAGFRVLNQIQAYLFNTRQEDDANKILKIKHELMSLKLERKKKFAQDAVDAASNPQTAVGNVAAMGNPTGAQ